MQEEAIPRTIHQQDRARGNRDILCASLGVLFSTMAEMTYETDWRARDQHLQSLQENLLYPWFEKNKKKLASRVRTQLRLETEGGREDGVRDRDDLYQTAYLALWETWNKYCADRAADLGSVFDWYCRKYFHNEIVKDTDVDILVRRRQGEEWIFLKTVSYDRWMKIRRSLEAKHTLGLKGVPTSRTCRVEDIDELEEVA